MNVFRIIWPGSVKLSSIQGRMGLLFLAFFLLVAVSVGVTFRGIGTQKNDALVINLAGRQRMLIQQMTRLSLEIEKGEDQTHHLALQEAMATFDQTLLALRYGGQAPYSPERSVSLPTPNNPILTGQLDRVLADWQAFKGSLEVISNTPLEAAEFEPAIRTVENLSPELVSQADTAVQMFEAESSHKIAQLRWIQIGFFASALVLLGLGGWMVRKNVLEPLDQLEAAAGRIGSGRLDSPVEVHAQGEIQVLADTFESMRTQIQTSQDKLVAWANTLEDKVAQRTSELEALYQVSRDISSRLDVQHVLRSVTDKARQLLKAEVALLCLLDEDGQVLNLHSASGPQEAVLRSNAITQGLVTHQILGGERAIDCGVEGCMGTCGIVAERFRTSHLAAPLRMGDRVIGALCVATPANAAFSDEDVKLLTKLANSAAIALENARLYAQAERLAILEERQRIAADMHDGLAQTLSFAQLSVDLASNQVEDGEIDLAVTTLQGVEKGLDQAVSEIRRAIASLQEDFPLYYTLQQQLANLVAEFSQQNDFAVEWQSEVNTPVVLPHEQAEQVLRVVRESLLNANRHAHATNVRVLFRQANGHFEAIIEDDGQGFDPSSPPVDDGRKHFGMNIMNARAARLRGQVNIESNPGQGTRVVLTWPQETQNSPVTASQVPASRVTE